MSRSLSFKQLFLLKILTQLQWTCWARRTEPPGTKTQPESCGEGGKKKESLGWVSIQGLDSFKCALGRMRSDAAVGRDRKRWCNYLIVPPGGWKHGVAGAATEFWGKFQLLFAAWLLFPHQEKETLEGDTSRCHQDSESLLHATVSDHATTYLELIEDKRKWGNLLLQM